MKRLTLAFVSAGLMTVYGCGGGSSAVTPSGLTSAVTPFGSTLQGVAATGAGFVDAVVKVIDSTGAVVGTSLPVGTDGIFNVTLVSSAKPPYLLVASRTTADGEVQTLVSVAESASVTIANITPITNLIASRLTPTGDPLKLVSELAAGTANITPASVAASVAEVKQILLPLLTATGTVAADPLKGTFTTNGTGYDRLLDSLKISITPASSTSSNIEIAVKQQLPDDTQPTPIQFVNSTATVTPLPTIDASTLVASGTSTLIADFLKSLTACFALPLTDRINTTGTTAYDIKDVACKNVFIGNAPSNFLSNGKVVGLNKAFDGIFTDKGTGAVFSQGSYEFTRTNGDLVIGYKSKSTLGNENFDTFVVRKDTDGKLKLIGNQYTHPGGVSAFHQFRQFITLDQSAFNYHSTGYNLNIEDIKKEDGTTSKFNRVVVSTPSGAIFTLKPKTGFSYLTLMLPNASQSGTTFIRLRSVYANGNTTPPISTKDSNLFFTTKLFEDVDIANIPAHSVWIFKYYFTAESSEIPVVQTYKTRSRALTIEELKHQGLAKLSDAVIATIQSQALPNNTGNNIGMSLIPTTGPIGGIDFTVPQGALPVTSIKIFGKYNSASFEDSVNFGSTARTGTVKCAAVSPDVHCSDMSGTYKAGNFANGLYLYSRDASGREYANFYAMYKLATPTQ